MKKAFYLIFVIITVLLSGCLMNNNAFDIVFSLPGDYGSFTHGQNLVFEFSVDSDDESGFGGTVEIYVDNEILDTLASMPFLYVLSTGNLGLGEHVFKAKAIDEGKSGVGELHFTLTGNAPVATFTIDPASATTDTVFYFSAEESSDVENTNDEMTYEWDFDNDGIWDGIGMNVFYQFSQSGNHTVRLKVTDSGGLGTEITNQVNVSPGSGSIPEGYAFVEGGSFRMSNRIGSYQDVTLTADYFIYQHEVTVEEYLAFLIDQAVNYNPTLNGNILMAIGSADCPIDIESNQYVYKSNDHFPSIECPAAKVSWYGALEYCNWLSEEEGLTPCYSISQNSATCSWTANGYRLPTEAEWEFAAMGGIHSRENYEFAGSDYLPSIAVLGYENIGPHPVQSKLPNELGLYDMTGNVYEWCWDIYEDPYANGHVTDPTGAASGNYKCKRGGYYYGDYNSGYPISKRTSDSPNDMWRDTGFRVVRLAQ